MGAFLESFSSPSVTASGPGVSSHRVPPLCGWEAACSGQGGARALFAPGERAAALQTGSDAPADNEASGPPAAAIPHTESPRRRERRARGALPAPRSARARRAPSRAPPAALPALPASARGACRGAAFGVEGLWPEIKSQY